MPAGATRPAQPCEVLPQPISTPCSLAVGIWEANGIDGYVALGREGKARVAVDPHTRAATHRMGEKLARAKGKAQYAKRKWMSEGPNGWVKEVLGFRRFSLRGLDKVRGEWHLVCLALNIRRLAAMAA